MQSSCWIPKLLNKDQKKGRVDEDNGLLKLIWSQGLGVQDRIVTLDQSAVSMHTPENK
jgi:hypothetical protein